MMPFFRVVIDEIITDTASINAAGFYQEFQRAVNGGLIDAGHPGLYMSYDFLSGKMPVGLVDYIHNQHTLRGQLEPFFL